MSELEEKTQCRLCLRNSAISFSLFEEDVVGIIENLTSIKISGNDNLPTTCCSQCLEDIYLVTSFRSRVIKSDKILREQNQINCTKNKQVKDEVSEVFVIKDEVDSNLEEIDDNLEGIVDNLEEVDDNLEEVVPVIPRNVPKSKTTVCDICGTQIKTANYKKHLQCHQSVPQICELCGATAKNMESLRGHMFYMHRSTAEQYKCKFCGKFFRYKYKFQLHIRKAHGGDRTHICEVCGKAFFTFREVNRHIQMTHMKLRPYICEYCGKGFSSAYARRTHIRQHTDERPFKCEVCAEGFRQRVSLKTHLRSKHGINYISETNLNTPKETLTEQIGLVKEEVVN